MTLAYRSVDVGFGIWLKREREKLEIRQAEFARMVGMSRSNLSQIENEYNHSTGRPIKPSPEFIRKAVKILQKHGATVSEYEAFKIADMTVPDEPTEPGREAIDLLDTMLERWAVMRRGREEITPDQAETIKNLECFGEILEYSIHPRPLDSVPGGRPERREGSGRRGNAYLLRVRGSSMEPIYRDGQVILVRWPAAIEEGRKYIVLVDGDSCCRILERIDEADGEPVYTFAAANGDYPPIRASVHRIQFQGRVLGPVDYED